MQLPGVVRGEKWQRDARDVGYRDLCIQSIASLPFGARMGQAPLRGS